MLDKVRQFAMEQRMWKRGDTIVCGVSGGADSVCLFLLLCEMQHSEELSLVVVHVHHGLRREADEEALFVERLCRRKEIPYYFYREDVAAYAKEKGYSTEEAGRILRYCRMEEVLEKVCQDIERGHIAVAHHQGDQAETVVWNLSRGTGLRGLAGISPVRGRIIRPLLGCSRDDIEAYLKEKEEPFCQDASNFERIYTRNRIRQQILPDMEEHLCQGATMHIAQAASQLRQLWEYLERQRDIHYEQCVCKENQRWRVNLDSLEKVDVELVPYLMQRVLEEVSKEQKDYSRVHIIQCMELRHMQVGKKINLPHGVVAYRDYGYLVFSKGERRVSEQEGRVSVQEGRTSKEVRRTFEHKATQDEMVEVTIPGSEILSDGTQVHFLQKEVQSNLKIPLKSYTKWVDYDKISKSLVLRRPMQGDYLVINEDGDRKLLRRYLMDEKIASANRQNIWVLAEGNHILWVLGKRMGYDYHVTSHTKRILEISIKGEQWNERED